MSNAMKPLLGRRAFLATAAGAAAGLATPALAQSSITDNGSLPGLVGDRAVRRNASSFRALSWQPYFSTLRNGAILVDISSRALHYWSEDQTIYKLYPTSVPMSEDLTRRGRTRVVRKVVLQ